MKQISLILIGGGDRGNSYLKSLQVNPEKFKLVGLAEPVKAKREHLQKTYNVPEEMCFESYEDLLDMPKMADVAMICTQDKMHFDPAMKAIEKKYDLLLEKPIAPTPQECLRICEAAKEKGVRVLVCHVLRYTPYYKTIKRIIDSGKIGEIININHTEGVGNYHMAHSYVRGNWRRVDESSPMLLAKCCHDTDLLQWLLGETCTKVHSFGDLTYFKKENAPEGATRRCYGCPHADTCTYYAPAYYKRKDVVHARGVVAKKFDTTDEELEEILKTSPYGRCVYFCDNDVVDHQVVNLEFTGGKNATLTMSAFNKGGRVTTIMGTKGELRADMENQSILFTNLKAIKTTEIYEAEAGFDESIDGGHGGGDYGIMQDLYEYIANNNPSTSISDITVSCMSHLICFAAEESRLNDYVVKMDKYIETL